MAAPALKMRRRKMMEQGTLKIKRMSFTGPEIEHLLEVLEGLLQSETEVAFAYFYGSPAEREKDEALPAPRDLDVAVYVQEADPFEVELRLQRRFYEETALPPEALDIRAINAAPLSIAVGILNSGRLIFCRDPLLHAESLENVANRCRGFRDLIEAAYA